MALINLDPTSWVSEPWPTWTEHEGPSAISKTIAGTRYSAKVRPIKVPNIDLKVGRDAYEAQVEPFFINIVGSYYRQPLGVYQSCKFIIPLVDRSSFLSVLYVEVIDAFDNAGLLRSRYHHIRK